MTHKHPHTHDHSSHTHIHNGHDHHHHDHAQEGLFHHHHATDDARALTIAIISTGTIFVAQIIGSYLSHSLALLSDAGHMLTDVAALLIALLALRYYTRSQSDKKKLLRYTFGFRRIEIIAALVNGVSLLGMCGFLLFEAIERLFNPQEVLTQTMMITAVIGLLANGVSAVVLHKAHHLSTRSAYLHVLTDLLSSVAVIVGGAVMMWTHWFWIDTVLSAGIAVFIIKSGIRLVKSAAVILMDSSPVTATSNEVHHALGAINGVKSVHDVHIWRVDDQSTAVSAHIVKQTEYNAETILADAQGLLTDTFAVHHSTIQIESQEYSDAQHCNKCSLEMRGAES